MHESNQDQGTTSHKDQKNTFKYYMKHGFKYDERAFRKEKIKNRDFATWNVSINRDNQVDIKWLRQLPAIKSAKKIQKINIHISRNYEITNQEVNNLGKALKMRSSLKNVSLVINSWNELYDKTFQKLTQKSILRFCCALESFSLSILFQSSQVGIYIPLNQQIWKGLDEGLNEGLNQGLKKLITLKNLNLTFQKENYIKDEWLQEFSNRLKRLSALQNLHIYLNSLRITNKGIQALGDGLKKLNNLKTLGLSFQCFTINGLMTLTETLKKIHPLQKIFIGFSGGSWSVMRRLSEHLRGLSSLKNVHLGTLRFPGLPEFGLKFLSQSLQEMKYLESLGLSLTNSQKIQDERFRELQESFKGLICLKNFTLQIKRSRVDLNDVPLLCEGLKELHALKNLTLSFSISDQIFNKELQPLSQALKKLEGLESLDLEILDGSQLTRVRMEELKEGFKILKNLQKLRLNFCKFKQISDEGIKEIALGIEELDSLKEINLTFSEFPMITNEGLKGINQSLKKMKGLQSVSLAFLDCGNIDEKGTLKMFQETLKDIWVKKIDIVNKGSRNPWEFQAKLQNKIFQSISNFK